MKINEKGEKPAPTVKDNVSKSYSIVETEKDMG